MGAGLSRGSFVTAVGDVRRCLESLGFALRIKKKQKLDERGIDASNYEQITGSKFFIIISKTNRRKPTETPAHQKTPKHLPCAIFIFLVISRASSVS